MLNYIDIDYTLDEQLEAELLDQGEPIDPPTPDLTMELQPQQSRRTQQIEEILVGESRPALEEQQEIQQQQQVMTPEMAALFQQRAKRRVQLQMAEQDELERRGYSYSSRHDRINLTH